MSTGTAPAKYMVGIITAHKELLESVTRELSSFFGNPDYVGPWHPFNHTSFYTPEMGANLLKCFVSFEKMIEPELLYKAKMACLKVEDQFRKDERRQVNLDPGYVDYYKVVLASGKYGGHKIAITRGCWADFIMMYSKGRWQPMPWCFPDFASGSYDNDLTEIRKLFKAARQKMGG